MPLDHDPGTIAGAVLVGVGLVLLLIADLIALSRTHPPRRGRRRAPARPLARTLARTLPLPTDDLDVPNLPTERLALHVPAEWTLAEAGPAADPWSDVDEADGELLAAAGYLLAA